MSAIKGDFISFTYNGVHSTDLGIMRVTASNRYTDQLLPTVQDKTVQVPGGNGTYFFGSNYTQRTITINIAYDSVTEDQIRLMRINFGDGKTHELIFDDEPYKVYYAKVTGTPQLTYIPFQNQDENANIQPRIYKGEGTLTFTCYEPFAHCLNNYKYLNQYTVNDPSWYKYDNKNEWNLSANLLSTKGTYDTYSSNTHSFKTYNPGDLEADFNLIIPTGKVISGIKINDGTNDLESYILLLKGTSITAKNGDTHICFNSKMNIIYGCNSSGVRTGNLYNEYIQSGNWFKIPKNQANKTWNLVLIDYTSTTPILKYDYLYY